MLDLRLPAVISLLAALEERLCAASRVRLVGVSAAAMLVVVFVWAVITGQSVVTTAGAPSSADFGFIYASGLAAASPHPTAVYDYAAFSALQGGVFGVPANGLPYYHFLYPPIFLLFTWALAQLPFGVAAVLWIGGTLLLYLVAANAILPRAAAILIPLTMPWALLKNAQVGQNGFLTAGLLGLALALAERQPVFAGVCLGLLTYKPQFGVLFPLALVIGGQWRMFASAAATAAALAIVTAIAFGHDIWPAYLHSLHAFDARLSPDRQVSFQYQSVFGWLQAGGAGAALALIVHLVAAAPVIGVVGALWYRRAPMPLRAAALAVGAAAVTPYVLTYDLCVLAIAAAFLLQDGLTRGFLVGDRLLLASCVATSLLLTSPIAPLLYALLLAVTLRRWLALNDKSGRVAPEMSREPLLVSGR